MDIQDIEGLKKLDEGEWRIYIANKIEKSILSASEVSALHGRINLLPCASHDEIIRALNAWKENCEKSDKDIQTEQVKGNQAVKVEKVKGSYVLKNAVIIAGIAAGTTVLNVVLNLIFTGKP